MHALQGERAEDFFVSVGTVSGRNRYVEIEVRLVRGQPV